MNEQSPSQAFALLAEPVQRWIWRQKWPGLRDIQEQAIRSYSNSSKDLIISAPTSGGKTEAAFLPLFSDFVAHTSDASGFRALAISPLKALINDQYNRLSLLGEAVGIDVYRWHGDVSQSEKNRARNRASGLLIITPESLEALFVRQAQRIPLLFGKLEAVIIDELHAFIGSERGIQLLSLLTRLEQATQSRPRRLALSATLGDRNIAREQLNPDQPEQVEFIEPAKKGERELLLQIRGYEVVRPKDEDQSDGRDPQDSAVSPLDAIDLKEAEQQLSTTRKISEHLFKTLRGEKHLVFAGSRGKVEQFTVCLNELCANARLPQEFFPHHGSLSKDIRYEAEKRLREDDRPCTAVCTSTLELGIDIGDVASVANIGAPRSVSGLKQRLGRSGRRPGASSILRIYTTEVANDSNINSVDELRFETVLAVASVRLLLKEWCEPPRAGALHLSTLVQQILSAITARGGANAAELYVLLCEAGPFRNITKKLFASLLRQLAKGEVGLLEQSPDGALMLGEKAEYLVEHYSFFAAFMTPEEYRIEFDGKTLGSLPIVSMLSEGMTLLFAGKRWTVSAVDEDRKLIAVVKSKSGDPPLFGGMGPPIHDMLMQEARAVYEDDEVPQYLNVVARGFLEQGRQAYKKNNLQKNRYLIDGDQVLLLPWTGTAKQSALELALISIGIEAGREGPGVFAKVELDELTNVLEDLEHNPPTLEQMAQAAETPARNPFDEYLGEELLKLDFAIDTLDELKAEHYRLLIHD